MKISHPFNLIVALAVIYALGYVSATPKYKGKFSSLVMLTGFLIANLVASIL